jgi:hypothetical protein
MRNMQNQDEVQEGGQVPWKDESQTQTEQVRCTTVSHVKESAE